MSQMRRERDRGREREGKEGWREIGRDRKKDQNGYRIGRDAERRDER